MKILVTGGAGYVGSHTVRALVKAGHDVTVFDNLSKGHREAVDPGATLIRGDLADENFGHLLKQNGYEAIIHFAALLNVGESVMMPLEYYRNNIVNSITLLEHMRAAKIKKLVFSSTCAVYGVPASLPITEDLPKAPINPYGETKLAMEWAFTRCAEAWGLGSIALRYFNASGASADGTIGQDYTPVMHLIPAILQVPLGQREKLSIFGDDYPTPDGSCVRDYIHVEDLADAHVLAVQAVEPAVAEAYNVGTGQGSSVKEVLDAARRVTGHDLPAEVCPRRPGDPPELYANASKIKNALGWEAQYTDIEKIIATAWQWHSTHPQGFTTR
jgi:UDP-glucose 4-epimerase